MGTPCAIGKKMEDGSVHAIRCNYDGYVAGAGVILGGWYTDAAKVEALLALGELSQLAEELSDCVAYLRDRGEVMRTARNYRDIDAYRRNGRRDLGADYLYLFDGNRWLAYGIPNEPDWVEIKVEK